MSRKESLFKAAAALAVAGLVIKISNLLVRVPLTRVVGSEGLGIYQMALPAFYALYHIAAGGVPVAVQNLVAEYTAKDRRAVVDQVLRMALTYTMIAGGAASALLLAGAPVLARMLGEHRAYLALVAVAPAVLLAAVDSIYRNYLQGRKLMTPSATASVIEQASKILTQVVLAAYLIRLSNIHAAAGAAAGITAGVIISTIYMVYVVNRVRREDGPHEDEELPQAGLARRMIALAWPVTLGMVSLPLLSLLDVGVVQRGFLKAFGDQSTATAMYGAYSGIAVQVVWFPFVLTNALSNALVPVLAAAAARRDKETVRERVLLGLRATGLICLPSAFGVAILAGPIARLFGEPQAAIPLMYMAPMAYLGPLAWLLVAQLQALGKTGIPMRNLAVAWVLKIAADATLAPIPGIDVKGVAAASVGMFLLVCWLNVRALERELGETLPWSHLLAGPLAASTVMGLGLFALAAGGVLPVRGWPAITVALAVAPVLYMVMLVVTRAVKRSDVVVLAGPLASRVERWLHVIWPWS